MAKKSLKIPKGQSKSVNHNAPKHKDKQRSAKRTHKTKDQVTSSSISLTPSVEEPYISM